MTLQMIRGKRDQLIGQIQERYGITRAEAELYMYWERIAKRRNANA
jgi:uncharacterized protein YjbJ (UPF0337 family)